MTVVARVVCVPVGVCCWVAVACWLVVMGVVCWGLVMTGTVC